MLVFKRRGLIMRSKNKTFLRVGFFAISMFITPLLSFTVILPSLSAADTNNIHVNPIKDLRPDFIMGADVSMLQQIEDNGGKFYDNGVEKDCLTILKDHGVNWIRLRIWNDPTDDQGKPLGGGDNDLERTVAMATRVKAMGLKLLLDFHYSDWWADPGKQNMPKAWATLG